MKYTSLFIVLLLTINTKLISQNINRDNLKSGEYAYLYILTNIIVDSSKDTIIQTSKIKLVLFDNGKTVDTLKYNYNKVSLNFDKILSDVYKKGWVCIKKYDTEEFEENISLTDIDEYVIINSFFLKRKL